MNFDDWLMRRVEEDTAAGFLARLLVVDMNLKAYTPDAFRDSARKLEYNEKILTCIDIAEVEYDAWCRWKAKQQDTHEKIIDKIAAKGNNIRHLQNRNFL